jgi:hypothetical protein
MMRRYMRTGFRMLLVLALIAPWLGACQSNWQIKVVGAGNPVYVVNRLLFDELEHFHETIDEKPMISLERLIEQAGYRLVDQVTFDGPDQARQTYQWAEIAGDAWLDQRGRLYLGGEFLKVTQIEVQPSPMLDQVEASIIDITSTAAVALGLRSPEEASGEPLITTSAEHVLLLFLDGFGYLRYQQAKEVGHIPYLGSLDPPRQAITTYPPVTVVASASVLTGALPPVHGLEQRGSRETETETLFDVAAEAGLLVKAVEGEALAFELRNASFKLSGDRNGNGNTDDEVLANTLELLEEGMPDLMWVHFHGIDDDGHTYGPGAPEEQQAVQRVDAAVERLVAELPANTLVIIFADHGMHLEFDGERQGNHGHLIPEDMLIPIFVFLKE